MLRLVYSKIAFVWRPHWVGILAGILIAMVLLGQIAFADSFGERQSRVLNYSSPDSNLFLPPVSTLQDTYAQTVAVGDFNHDGRKDVVLGNGIYAPQNLYFLIQQPNGSLGAPQLVISDAAICAFAVGDVTGDGLDDLVVANIWANRIGVLSQKQDGTMAAQVNYDSIPQPNNVELGDVNADGKLDILVSNAISFEVRLQKNDGTLKDPVVYSSPQINSSALEFGDLNGDHLTDVVTTNWVTQDFQVIVFYQQNDGSLLGQVAATLLNAHASGVAVGDVSGDGRDDVAITNGDNAGRLFVLQQQPNGTLAPATTYDAYEIPAGAKIYDVNQDGRKDVVTLHVGWNRVGIFLQNSSGTLGAIDLYPNTYGAYSMQPMAIGDIDSDGYADIITAYPGLTVLEHVNPIKPQTATPTFTPTPTNTPMPVTPTLVPTKSPAIVKTIMSEGFEGVFPRDPWVVTASGWGKSNCQKFSGSYSAWAIKKTGAKCGDNYPVNQKNWMVWGPFSLYKAKGADLWFNLRLEAEQGKDSLFVGVSRDNKKFYGLSYTGSTGGAKAYSAEWNAQTGDFYVDSSQAEKVVRNAPDASWGYGHLDLTNVYKLGNVTGNPKLWFAFVWRSDAENTLPNGAFVDDIRLTKTIKK